MKREEFVDFHIVADHHLAIHERLNQWARWVRVRPVGWQVSPMFRQYRSKSWQWERPEPREEINVPEALEIERAVSLLPEKHRTAIRWCYVLCGAPGTMARTLGVSKQGLCELIASGRKMLVNRTGGRS